MGTGCDPFLYTMNMTSLTLENISTNYIFAKTYNIISRYIDDLISLNNKHFWIHINVMYPFELGKTMESPNSASYLDQLADIKDYLTFKVV